MKTRKPKNSLQKNTKIAYYVNAKLMKTEIQIRKTKADIQMKKKREKNEKHNERKQELSQIWKHLIFLDIFIFMSRFFLLETHIDFWSSLIMSLCMLKLFLAVLSKLFFSWSIARWFEDGSAILCWLCHALPCSAALFRIATHTVASFLGRLSITGRWCMRPAPVTVLVSMVVIRVSWQVRNHMVAGCTCPP